MTEISNMIISALVGSIAVWLARDIIIPVSIGFVSNSAKLHKNWKFKDTESGQAVGTAVISQLGSQIKIKATRTINREGETTNREFIYQGKITGRTLVLNFEQKKSGSAVSGAIVLRLDSELGAMVGKTSYFSDSTGVISNPIYYDATV